VRQHQPDDVLVVLEDITLSDRIVTAAEMTIKGLTGNEKITRMFKDKLMFSAGKTLNFQNITLDCNNMQNNNYELEANALMTLENVVIANSVSTKGLINVKPTRTVSLNNVTKSAAAACRRGRRDSRLRHHPDILRRQGAGIHSTPRR